MKDKKERKICNTINKILNIDGLFLAGEGIKDLVVCSIVIHSLLYYYTNIFLVKVITNLSTISGKLGIVFFIIGIMLVPMYYASKWLRIILEGKK